MRAHASRSYLRLFAEKKRLPLRFAGRYAVPQENNAKKKDSTCLFTRLSPRVDKGLGRI
jgi:hypothetical protein